MREPLMDLKYVFHDRAVVVHFSQSVIVWFHVLTDAYIRYIRFSSWICFFLLFNISRFSDWAYNITRYSICFKSRSRYYYFFFVSQNTSLCEKNEKSWRTLLFYSRCDFKTWNCMRGDESENFKFQRTNTKSLVKWREYILLHIEI